jgi:hypothetical protein
MRPAGLQPGRALRLPAGSLAMRQTPPGPGPARDFVIRPRRGRSSGEFCHPSLGGPDDALSVVDLFAFTLRRSIERPALPGTR